MKDILYNGTNGKCILFANCERCGNRILYMPITREQLYDFRHEYIYLTDLLVDIEKKSIDEARKMGSCYDRELCPKCLENLKERGFITE